MSLYLKMVEELARYESKRKMGCLSVSIKGNVMGVYPPGGRVARLKPRLPVYLDETTKFW